MATAAKIAITVDRELLARAEKLRRGTGESRSALLARALRRLLHEEEHRRRVAEYVAAYRRQPESAAELALAKQLAVGALSALPWEDD